MAPTQLQLVRVQKAIGMLFRRRVRRTPDVPDPEPLLNPTLRAEFVSTDAYRWGLKNLAGVAVSWPKPPEVQLHLSEQPTPEFAQYLSQFFPGIPLRFLVTGHFHFLVGQTSVGADISLHGVPAIGRVALFLKDARNQSYALTCAHVLEGDANQQPPLQVDSQGQRIGVLTHRVDLIYGCMDSGVAEGNEVDCALAKLDDQIRFANALLGAAGGTLSAIGSAQQHDQVSLVNSSRQTDGTVSRTLWDGCLFDPTAMRFAYFENLLSIEGTAGIGSGSSGTVVVSATNQPVGMVIGSSLLSGLVVACDMGKMIRNLELLFPEADAEPKLSLVSG